MQKTIFITGASSGLGKAAAQLFQSQGWKVIATMRNPERETELSRLEGVRILQMDITESPKINATVRSVLNKGSVDVVLNNAGYGLIGPLEALSDKQIKAQLDTNLIGMIHVTKAFLPYFRERKSGTFINVTSTFGLLGFPTCSIYNAAKFGVDGFSEGLAHELVQFGIQVKVVAPGGMQTDFAGRSLQAASHPAYEQLSAKVSEGYSQEQIGNYTKAEDVAQVIYDAATDGSGQFRYVAGKDAIALYHQLLEAGPEAQVQRIKAGFMF